MPQCMRWEESSAICRATRLLVRPCPLRPALPTARFAISTALVQIRDRAFFANWRRRPSPLATYSYLPIQPFRFRIRCWLVWHVWAGPQTCVTGEANPRDKTWDIRQASSSLQRQGFLNACHLQTDMGLGARSLPTPTQQRRLAEA
jgi:hypothetical protein